MKKWILSGMTGLAILSAVPATAETVKVSTGFFYADGQSNDLNASNVTLRSVPVNVSVQNGPINVKLGTSWLEIKSGTAAAQSGQGDTTLTLRYDVTPNWSVSIKEKFATGSKSKGLSTGYNDTKVQVDAFWPQAGGRSVFATLGYTFKGGQSDNPNYQNAAYASLGMAQALKDGWSVGLSIDAAQATSKTLDDTFGGMVFLGYRVSPRVSVNVFGGYDTTQTKSGGLGLSVKL